MEPAPLPEEPLNVWRLTDEELLALLPIREEKPELPADQEKDGLTAEAEREKRLSEAVAKLTAQERQAIEELWRRYSASIQRYLGYKVFETGSSLCPPHEPDKKHFVTICVHETYLRFLTHARKQPMRKGFKAFFFWTALCVALDQRRRIAKQRGSVPPPVEIVPLGDRDAIQDEVRGPEELAALAQLRNVLENYAAESPQNMLSIRVARLKRGEGKTWQEVLASVEERFSLTLPGSTAEAKKKNLRDFEKHDTQSILPRLREYRISDPALFDALLKI